MYLQTLLASLPGDDETKLRILDLGCGAGIPTASFLLTHLQNAHVTSTDISSTQLLLAADHLARYTPHSLTLLELDMSDLSFPPSSFDAVTATYSVVHLPRAEQPLANEIYRIMVEAGRLHFGEFWSRRGYGVR